MNFEDIQIGDTLYIAHPSACFRHHYGAKVKVTATIGHIQEVFVRLKNRKVVSYQACWLQTNKPEPLDTESP